MVESSRPQLVNSSILFRNNNILGTPWSYATVNLQFDQELYVTDMIMAPYMDEACPPLPSCQPCDWTDASGAGSSSPCSLACCGPSSTEQLEEWCNPSIPFTPLVVNQVSGPYDLENGDWGYYRFYLGPDSWCSPGRVHIRLLSGQLDAYISQDTPYPVYETAQIGQTTPYARNHQSLTLAPWIDDTVGIGTFVLALSARTRARFTIEVQLSPLKIPLNVPSDPEGCSDIPEQLYPTDNYQGATDLVCLQDTVTTTFPPNEAGTEYQLVWSVPPGCHTSSVIAYPLLANQIGTDIDLYCIPLLANNSVTYANAIFASYTSSADYLVFTTCSEQRVWFRCVGDLWSPGPVAFFFSTVAPTSRTAITQLDSYDFTTFAGINSMAVATPGSFSFGSPACADWNSGGCSFFWPTYPTADPRPFWPPPDGITDDAQYQDMLPFNDLLLPSMREPVPGLFVMTIVLSSPLAEFSGSPEDFLATPNLVLLASNLANENGETVQFPANMTGVPSFEASLDIITPTFAYLDLAKLPIRSSSCTSSSFNQVVNATSPLIDQLATTDQLFVTRYQIDTFTATLAYSSCYESVRALLATNTTNITTTTQECLQDSGTADWNVDPCCNQNQLVLSCCAPQEVATSVTSYYDADSALVDAQCSNPACAHSFLSSFAQVLNQQQDPITACEVSLSSLEKLISESRALLPLRECRIQSGVGINFDGVPCDADADCQTWPGAICQQSIGRCRNISLEALETAYLQCYISQLNGFQLQWLKEHVLPPNNTNLDPSSDQFFQLLRAAASVPDCLGTSSPFDITWRSRWETHLMDQLCAETVMQAEYGDDWTQANFDEWCSTRLCLGLSCNQPASNCISYCYFPTDYVTIDQAQCEEEAAASLCRFPSCSNPSAQVCAYCPELDSAADAAAAASDSPCIVVPGASSADQCNNAVVCELPDGTFTTQLTADQCTAISSCSVDCPGSSCRSEVHLNGACVATAANSEASCQTAAAAADSDYQFLQSSTCILVDLTYSFECEALSVPHAWVSCTGRSPCDRSTPALAYLQCFTDIFQDCSDAQSCTAAGRCSDLEVIPRVIDSNTWQASYGGCFSSGFYSSIYLLQDGQDPMCGRAEFQVRNGCLAPIDAIDSAASCTPSNPWFPAVTAPVDTAWLTPALSESSCSSQVGCWEATAWYDRLSWRNSSECLLCGGIADTFWTWQAGTWKTGTVRQAQWQTTAPTTSYQWQNNSLSFPLTEQWILDALTDELSIALRSAALCNFELITSPLSSLVCSCFNDGSTKASQCFINAPSAIPEALGKACHGVNSTISFGLSSIEIGENDVETACVAIELSRIDKSRFDSTGPPPQVSFRLALPQESQDSPVKNEQGRVVGVLVGDGVKIDVAPAGQLNAAYLCLQVSSNQGADSRSYPVIDFGLSDASLDAIVPLGLVDVVLLANEDETLLLYCGQLTSDDQIDEASSFYFPIRRVADYEGGSSSTYSVTDEALVYTLGALYSLCLVLISMFTAVAAWWWYRTDRARVFTPLAGLFFVFLCIFRLVYCFMLPSDVITDDVANYAVFELPTFFYFTSFSIVLAIWFEALDAFGLRQRRRMLGWYIIISINTVAYLLFIAVMIAVAVISSQPSEDPSQCPGRVAATATDKATETRNLSLAYQSIIIAITFLFTLGFLHSVYTISSRSRRLGRSWSETYAKSRSIINIAVIVVLGFLTRCVLFIIILALDFTSTIYMFITLTITEIFVILGVCSQFSVIRIASQTIARTYSNRSSGRSNVSGSNLNSDKTPTLPGSTHASNQSHLSQHSHPPSPRDLA